MEATASSIMDLLGTLASFVAMPVLFGLYPRWRTGALLTIDTIRNVDCAGTVVHESDHGSLYRDARGNRRPGILLAYLLGYVRPGHRGRPRA
jgi:hypothetical protein